MSFFEEKRLLLKLLKRIGAAFFEAEFARPDQALFAMPIIVRHGTERRVKTVSVVTIVAAFTDQDVLVVVTFAACLADLYRRLDHA